MHWPINRSVSDSSIFSLKQLETHMTLYTVSHCNLNVLERVGHVKVWFGLVCFIGTERLSNSQGHIKVWFGL